MVLYWLPLEFHALACIVNALVWCFSSISTVFYWKVPERLILLCEWWFIIWVFICYSLNREFIRNWHNGHTFISSMLIIADYVSAGEAKVTPEFWISLGILRENGFCIHGIGSLFFLI